MFIDRADQPSAELLTALHSLIPQLGAGKPVLSKDELTLLLKSGSSTLLIARYPDRDSEIVGILTLTIYPVPTGIRSIIEDVVVDEKFRGRGIASALLSRSFDLAREAGAVGVSLTSNPNRMPANLLYQKIGFEKRETNSYYYPLK